MKVGIPKERRRGEARVAGSPDMVRKLVAMGLEVMVEAGAGDGAGRWKASQRTHAATNARKPLL